MQETWAIHGVYPNMAWLPNSAGMVFWSGGEINKLDLKSKKTTVIPFHVKTEKKIQTALRFQQDIDQDNFDVKMLRDVEISPDGSKVVYESMGHIYVRGIADGKAKGKALVFHVMADQLFTARGTIKNLATFASFHHVVVKVVY